MGNVRSRLEFLLALKDQLFLKADSIRNMPNYSSGGRVLVEAAIPHPWLLRIIHSETQIH